MNSLVQSVAGRVVGTVEEVSADKIMVLLDPDAPQATALNSVFPTGFPRINGYLLIPNETGATVGLITSVRIERLPFPKRRGMQQDFDLVDLPFPCRIAFLTPLGTLVYEEGQDGCNPVFRVRRGVDVFPSVGDSVLLPTRNQLRAIVAGESRDTFRVLIGHCPTAAGAPVWVNPDKLFGRHLAVLGNTGAGKSCSVAGLIRWCLNAAQEERKAQKRQGFVNARFIILDPNGEYSKAFQDLNTVRLFQVQLQPGIRANSLKVPAWLWNGEEWAAFTEASPGIQRPILFDALRRLRSNKNVPDDSMLMIWRMVRLYQDRLKLLLTSGEYQGKRKREETADVLLNISKDFDWLQQHCDARNNGLRESLSAIAEQAAEIERLAQDGVRENGHWHRDFAGVDIIGLLQCLKNVAESIGLPDDDSGTSEDAPCYFPIEELPSLVEALAGRSSKDLAQFVDSLNLRIKSLMRREGLAQVLNPTDSASIKLEDWLEDYIGGDNAANGQIAIIDLSLLPSDVIHIVVAVIARLVFEALQRYRRQTGQELPTVLVLDEAHSFVNKALAAKDAPAAGRVCCRAIERIAREGRKFGLGLVLASQRPSELSETVLSQCNTFLLHRIVNDHDQELVRRLVPEGVGALLRDLPSLPSRRAILLGSAAPAPVLVEMRELSEAERPQSPDPAFWDVWTGDPQRGQRRIDWAEIVRKWIGHPDAQEKSETPEKPMTSGDGFETGQPDADDVPWDDTLF
ncbi:MAG: hypothetical protein PWQ86_1172 [Bacillota bacterium]|jgi:hypothetical protein|nr:hypothetical protein [Bacillota bacterium]